MAARFVSLIALALSACGGQATESALSAEELLPKSARVTVSAGGGHTCALRDNGRVACWGRGQFGALGNGIEAARSAWQEVAALDVEAHSVLSGGQHTCMLDTSGSVWCWGDSREGQAGSYARPQFPAEIKELHQRVDQLSVGRSHNCALLRDGSVECWGHGGSGALGHSFQISEVPQRVDGLPKATQVVAGRDYSCALTATAEVFCWGNARGGIVGDVITHGVAEPVHIAFAAPVASLARASGDLACAVLQSGALMCWGSTADERLDVPLQHSLQSAPRAVSLGAGQSCSITQAATLDCWPELSGLESLPDLTDVAEVSAGQQHVCARTAAELWCWGATVYGQTGGDLNSGEPVLVDL